MAILRFLTALAMGATVSNSITFVAGPPTQGNSTLVANPNTATADGTTSVALTFTAIDYYGNLAPGVGVTLSASGGNNTFGAISGATDANGVFATTLTSTFAQSEVITASLGNSSIATTSVQFVPGAASSATSSLVLSPNSQVADNNSTILASLTLRDVNNNPIPNITPTFMASGSSTTISSPPISSASGLSSATYQTPLAQNEDAVVMAGGLSFISAMTFVSGPIAQAASSLSANPNALPADGSAATTLTLTARDAQGNPVSGATVGLAASGGNNTFGSISGTTAANGIFATSLSSILGQTETITAALNANITETASVVFAQVANTTTSTLSVSPSSQTVGPSNLITATLTLRDRQSKAIANIGPIWTASGGNNTIVQSGNTNASGVATATFSSTLAQTETAQVVAGGVTLTKSVTFVAGSPNATTSLMYSKPTRQIANNSNVITAYVLLRDIYYNPTANRGVTFSASGSSTTVTANGNTNTAGVALATYKTAISQNENAVITSAGVSLTQPLIFTSTPTACTLSVSPASAPADGNTPLVVTAKMLGGANNANAIANVLVNFSSSGGATNFQSSNVISNNLGTAATSITSLTGGPNKFTAQSNGIQCASQGNFLFRSPSCSGTPTYMTSTVPTAAAPHDILARDLNNDGILDLIISQSTASTLSVMLGNGDGSFGSYTSYPAGVTGTYLGSGDVNADGYIDIVVTNYAANTVSIYLGSKNGTLTLINTLTGLSRPEGLSVFDLDGDGALDLAVNNLGGSNVLVFLGTNTGQFLPLTSYPANVRPNTMLGVGDFNADGLADIAVPNYNGTTLSVLLGSKPGAFNSPSSYAVTNYSVSGVAVSDFNGDGIQDLAVNGSSNPNVDILLGSGTGSFATAQSVTTNGVSQMFQIDDLNGDGVPDLVVPDMTNNSLSLLLGVGGGKFGSLIVQPINGAQPYGIVIGDFDSDGYRYIINTNYNSSTISISLYAACQSP